MSRLKEALDWRFWIWQPILALLVPYLVNQVKLLNTNFKIIVVFFIINLIYSVYAGAYLRKNGAFWYLLLVWPILFLISVWLLINSRQYGYYLAALYLIVELFAFTRGQQKEIDVSDQIPIEGGFKQQE